MIPRRSVLYLPGANTRALEKARTLACDSLILDLEDAVAPANKAAARANVTAAINAGGFGYRELVVRVNGLDTPWGRDDLQAVAGLDVAAVLFPKVDSAPAVQDLLAALDAAGGDKLPVWLMIESAGIDALDGVHLDFRNTDSFRDACVAARDMGFDGKTLIHPAQIDIANECFGPDPAAVDHAERVLATWQAALAEGRGVAELDGQLIENLHAAEAERTLAYASALAARDR